MDRNLPSTALLTAVREPQSLCLDTAKCGTRKDTGDESYMDHSGHRAAIGGAGLTGVHCGRRVLPAASLQRPRWGLVGGYGFPRREHRPGYLLHRAWCREQVGCPGLVRLPFVGEVPAKSLEPRFLLSPRYAQLPSRALDVNSKCRYNSCSFSPGMFRQCPRYRLPPGSGV